MLFFTFAVVPSAGAFAVPAAEGVLAAPDGFLAGAVIVAELNGFAGTLPVADAADPWTGAVAAFTSVDDFASVAGLSGTDGSRCARMSAARTRTFSSAVA